MGAALVAEDSAGCADVSGGGTGACSYGSQAPGHGLSSCGTGA